MEHIRRGSLGIIWSRGPHGGEARDARRGGVRRGHHLASLLSRGLSPIQSPNPESALDRWQRARGDKGHVCSNMAIVSTSSRPESKW